MPPLLRPSRPAGTQGHLRIRKARDMRPNQPRAKLLFQLCKAGYKYACQGPAPLRDRCVWALGELTYGAHSTHGLHACPFDLLSAPATRATPRSDVGRDAKVIPLSAPRNGLHHRLPRARGRLSDAREVGLMPLVDGEKPGSAATSVGASWRAPSTAEGIGAVYDRAETGPPPEKGAQCFSSQLYPACGSR